MNIQTEIKPCLADYPDALTVDEVIAILRVSRKTVYELIKDGRIKAVKVGRSHRIAKENLIEFLNPAAAHSNPGCVLSDNNREKVWTCEQQCGTRQSSSRGAWDCDGVRRSACDGHALTWRSARFCSTPRLLKSRLTAKKFSNRLRK